MTRRRAPLTQVGDAPPPRQTTVVPALRPRVDGVVHRRQRPGDRGKVCGAPSGEMRDIGMPRLLCQRCHQLRAFDVEDVGRFTVHDTLDAS